LKTRLSDCETTVIDGVTTGWQCTVSTNTTVASDCDTDCPVADESCVCIGGDCGRCRLAIREFDRRVTRRPMPMRPQNRGQSRLSGSATDVVGLIAGLIAGLR
jgi:hypothetical protein